MPHKVLYLPEAGHSWTVGTVGDRDYKYIVQRYLDDDNLLSRQFHWFSRVVFHCKTHAEIREKQQKFPLSGIIPFAYFRGRLPKKRFTAMPFFGYDFKSNTPFSGFQHQAIITGIGGALAYAILEAIGSNDFSTFETFLIYLAITYAACMMACYFCHLAWGYCAEVLGTPTTIFTDTNAAQELTGEAPPKHMTLCITFTSGQECPSATCSFYWCWVNCEFTNASSAAPNKPGTSTRGSLLI